MGLPNTIDCFYIRVDKAFFLWWTQHQFCLFYNVRVSKLKLPTSLVGGMVWFVRWHIILCSSFLLLRWTCFLAVYLCVFYFRWCIHNYLHNKFARLWFLSCSKNKLMFFFHFCFQHFICVFIADLFCFDVGCHVSTLKMLTSDDNNILQVSNFLCVPLRI